MYTSSLPQLIEANEKDDEVEDDQLQRCNILYSDVQDIAMRFRTSIHNVPLLHKITRSLSALARACVIRLSEENVHFIVPSHENSSGVQVWSQVKVSTLFSAYKIESNAGNEIWLELHLDSLARVLRSADSSVGGIGESNRTSALTESEVLLKLNKKGSQPILSFEIRGYTAGHGKSMSITHEINVKILSLKRQGELQEPLCPTPDIHVVLPNLFELRNLVSRLSHVADDVTVEANGEGTMNLQVRSDRVHLTTEWKNLQIPTSTTDEEEAHDPPPKERFFHATVSIKGLLKFLTSHVVGGTAIACICEDHCVIAYVYIGELSEAGGVLTFFIPTKNAD